MGLLARLPPALLLVLSAGCARKQGAETAGANLDTVTASVSDSLRISLIAPGEAPPGRSVPIVIRLENIGTRPMDLSLRGRTITFDILITRPDGEIVWQRLRDEVIPAIIQLKVLQPGESLELEAEWNQRDNNGKPVPSGIYSVRGSVLTDGPALETHTASLRIGS
jgi:hypothetical protein